MERYVEKVMEAVHFQKSISFVNHDSFGMKIFFMRKGMKNLTGNVWQLCCELLLS